MHADGCLFVHLHAVYLFRKAAQICVFKTTLLSVKALIPAAIFLAIFHGSSDLADVF